MLEVTECLPPPSALMVAAARRGRLEMDGRAAPRRGGPAAQCAPARPDDQGRREEGHECVAPPEGGPARSGILIRRIG